MQIRVKRLHPDAVIPKYVHIGDSGFDLYAIEDVIVEPGQTVKVRTGLSFEIPDGYELQIRPRSGVSAKTKLRVSNTPGTVDASYRGEVMVLVDNITPIKYNLHTDQPDDEIIYELSEQTAWGHYVTVIDERTAHSDVGNWLNTINGDKVFHPENDFGPRYLDGTYIIKKGDRIAQGVIVPVIRADIVEVDELSDTTRGTGGFGSTGVR
jgi:dUTP pyrophosphatase